ncbi:hypothetical protein [Leuconostoc mesenteroides]|uniref:hypothetical protein n=1 Tax=Leuconostoc mesenteroides TaxID=1245 RepID=UPI003749E185
MKRVFEINPWTVATHDLNPEDKRSESMTVWERIMGMRGMFEEVYSGTHKDYWGLVPDKTGGGGKMVTTLLWKSYNANCKQTFIDGIN